jgi:hypothetical protein
MWKKIKWFEKYEISNLWKVRSLYYNNTNQIKELLPNKLYYVLYWNTWIKNIKISRLVAQAFLWLDIDNKDICVLHIDWNKINNSVDNLILWIKWDWLKNFILNNPIITHKKRRRSQSYKEQTQEIIKLKREWLTLLEISEIIWLSTSYISMISNWKRRVYQNIY